MDKNALEHVLMNHALWLENTSNGTRADLTNANLRHADLRYADLRHANLRYADLEDADLTNANLRYADLTNANLRYANLENADLTNANLTNANLRYANLEDADLTNANLRYADLSYANLTSANLTITDLRYADLTNANLKYVNPVSILVNIETRSFFLHCPEEGSFIGWKTCRNNVLVKLLIPEDALRSSATTHKCRASKAIVLDVIGADIGYSRADSTFTYKKGETVEPTQPFDTNRWNECSTGIHFFLTKEEARLYD